MCTHILMHTQSDLPLAFLTKRQQKNMCQTVHTYSDMYIQTRICTRTCTHTYTQTDLPLALPNGQAAADDCTHRFPCTHIHMCTHTYVYKYTHTHLPLALPNGEAAAEDAPLRPPLVWSDEVTLIPFSESLWPRALLPTGELLPPSPRALSPPPPFFATLLILNKLL